MADGDIRTPPRARPSRYIPESVKRAVRRRDNGRCAFVSAKGHRCTERAYLEYHHATKPYALGGEATVDNIALHCRAHNQYEAERIFGPRTSARGREDRLVGGEGG